MAKILYPSQQFALQQKIARKSIREYQPQIKAVLQKDFDKAADLSPYQRRPNSANCWHYPTKKAQAACYGPKMPIFSKFGTIQVHPHTLALAL